MKRVIVFACFVAAICRGQEVSYADAVIPHMPIGCGYRSSIILVNPTVAKNSFEIRFYDLKGSAKFVPVLRDEKPELKSSVAGMIMGSGSTEVIIAASEDQDPACFGWAEVTSNDVVAGYVILTQVVGQSTYDATVPFASRFANRFVVPFRQKPGIYTSSLALVNPSFVKPAAVRVSFRASDGAYLCSESRTILQGHQEAFVFEVPKTIPVGVPPERFLQSASCADSIANSQTGVVEIETDNPELSGFGLRLTPAGFVSFPAQRPIVQNISESPVPKK